MSDDDRRQARASRSLLGRLFGVAARQPLRLVAVPRDHVVGDRARGDALLAGRAARSAARRSTWPISTSPRSAATAALARDIQSFAWLRDLAAAATRERGARLAEAIAGRWLIAHGTQIDDAWAPDLWGERILFWTAYAPYILSSRDPAIARPCSTRSRAARATSTRTADKAAPGLPRITAWAGVIAAALIVQGGDGAADARRSRA